MLVTLYNVGHWWVHLHCLGAHGFHAKAENGTFIAEGLHCCQNLKNENFTSLFGRLHEKFASKSLCRMCSMISFCHSTNEIIDLWYCHNCCSQLVISETRSYLLGSTPLLRKLNNENLNGGSPQAAVIFYTFLSYYVSSNQTILFTFFLP